VRNPLEEAIYGYDRALPHVGLLAHIVGDGGASDWNCCAVVAYTGHDGVPAPFGSPVRANCVQYRTIASDSSRPLRSPQRRAHRR